MAKNAEMKTVCTGFNRERKTIKEGMYSIEGAYCLVYKHASEHLRACLPTIDELKANKGAWVKYKQFVKETNTKHKAKDMSKVSYNTAYMFVWGFYVKEAAAKGDINAKKCLLADKVAKQGGEVK